MMTKVFLKKLFGTRYEKIIRSIIINIALFGGLQGAGVKISVAPFIIYLMTTAITISEMWQALSAEDNSENMKNMIMMPFDNRGFVVAYVGSLGLYTLISRVMPVLAMVFAVSKIDVLVVVNSILCVLNGSFLTAVLYAKKKIRIIAGAWIALIIVGNHVCGITIYYSVILLISTAIAFLITMMTDAYAFYDGDGMKNQTIKSRKNASIIVYIFRYMKSHKNYFTNTVFFWGVAMILPIVFKQLDNIDSGLIKMVIPMGFAIMCMNTPIGIILSSDRALEQAVRVLPEQKKTFCLPYFGFIAVCNLIAESIYLVSCQIQLGGVSKELVLAAMLFGVQSAILSVLLEWFMPIRNWKIENDLWHHPRKYIIPAIILVLSGIVGVNPIIVYGFFIVLVIEGAYLLYSIK